MPVQTQRSYKWIPRLQIMSLEGKGHWVMIEARDIVTESVVQLFNSFSLGPSPRETAKAKI
jgi:soluble epoxide hydrolase/lipid-phosphate phosphatase